MTKHIGRAYRRNRSYSWLLVAAVVAIAAAAIPIASGHDGTSDCDDDHYASISNNTTSCYGTISGTVWQDTNENATRDATPPEPVQGGVPINLYKKTLAGWSLSKSVPSATDGTYTLPMVRFGRTYLVCEHPVGVWVQSKPSVATPPCETNGNKANGYALTSFAASVTGEDFGNVPAVMPKCDSTFTGGSTDGTFDYTAQLTAGTSGCKNSALVMVTYNDGTRRVATLHPAGNAGTGCPGPTCLSVVERIRWGNLPLKQNPITLRYDDTYPYGDVTQEMPMCIRDPRPDPVNHPFVLGSNPASVLPAPHTSCMIISTETAGTYEAYIYSSVDGYRGDG